MHDTLFLQELQPPKVCLDVLQHCTGKIGPGVRFREEEIQRIRTSEVSKDESYRLPLKTKRSLRKEPEIEVEKEPFLLPEPEDPFRLPSLDSAEEEEEDEFLREPEPVKIPEKMKEAVRNRGSRGDDVRRIAQEMQRATSRWPGPEKVPRYIPRKEIAMAEKQAKREAKRRGKM